MTIIILGLLLWTLVHVWKRVAPDHRASFGEKGKVIVAFGSIIATILMVIGYLVTVVTTTIKNIGAKWQRT